MSNIEHYEGKMIPGLQPGQGKKLDKLLVAERDRINSLLDMDYVKLKCICWPELRLLNDEYYTKEQKQKRVVLMRYFLNNSFEKYVDRRQVLCNEAGSYGNQLIIGDKLAIIANPKSGGYTETSIFTDQHQYIIDL